MLDFLLAAAEPSLSIEALLIKLVTTTGGVGLAGFLAYIVYKLVMRRQNGATAKDVPPGATPATGLPTLGGANPAGDEVSGVTAIPPEKQPVSRGELTTHCKAVHSSTDARFDSVNQSLADTNTKIDKMELKLDKVQEGVGEIRETVAVLKDRTDRGG